MATLDRRLPFALRLTDRVDAWASSSATEGEAKAVVKGFEPTYDAAVHYPPRRVLMAAGVALLVASGTLSCGVPDCDPRAPDYQQCQEARRALRDVQNKVAGAVEDTARRAAADAAENAREQAQQAASNIVAQLWQRALGIVGLDRAGASAAPQLADRARVEMVTRVYRELLGRDPDATGLRSWYESAQSEAQIRAGIMASVEYCQRRRPSRTARLFGEAVSLQLPMCGNVEVVGFLPHRGDHEGRDLYAVDLKSDQVAVYPIAVGKVVYAGFNCEKADPATQKTCYGNTVVVEHLGGLYSVYVHLASVGLAKVGDAAQPDVALGAMSDSGCRDESGTSYCVSPPGSDPGNRGAHLHFSLRRGDPGLAQRDALWLSNTPVNLWELLPGLPADPQLGPTKGGLN